MKRGGQVSVEYMMILGLAFFLLLPGAYLFYNYSQGSQTEMQGSQLHRAGTQIIDQVRAMYAAGENSWTTVGVNLPEQVTGFYILNEKELVIEYETPFGKSETVFFSRVNMTTNQPEVDNRRNVTGNFHTGLMKIRVTSQGRKVMLKEVS